jgi:NADH dehydrogenase (ubiquinone) Fe-S protein 2
MEFYERVSGARMHAAYIRPGGIAIDLPRFILDDVHDFICQFQSRLYEIELFLTYNRIWRQRLMGVGTIDADYAVSNSFSGVMARSCGLPFDLRKNYSYEIYRNIDFVSLLGVRGDSYDRYILRVEEMRQSCMIILHCLNNIPYGDYNVFQKKASLQNNYMEAIINHFKYYFENVSPASNFVYVGSEAPKGEFGVSFVSDGSNKPYRTKFRAPGFFHLQGLPNMVKDVLLADLVTIIGTQDLVFGEIDK